MRELQAALKSLVEVSASVLFVAIGIAIMPILTSVLEALTVRSGEGGSCYFEAFPSVNGEQEPPLDCDGLGGMLVYGGSLIMLGVILAMPFLYYQLAMMSQKTIAPDNDAYSDSLVEKGKEHAPVKGRLFGALGLREAGEGDGDVFAFDSTICTMPLLLPFEQQYFYWKVCGSCCLLVLAPPTLMWLLVAEFHDCREDSDRDGHLPAPHHRLQAVRSHRGAPPELLGVRCLQALRRGGGHLARALWGGEDLAPAL